MEHAAKPGAKLDAMPSARPPESVRRNVEDARAGVIASRVAAAQ
jgi:hypothetical protein